MEQDCKPGLDLRVLDLGVGMPAALVVRMLLDAGAAVTRVEPPGGDPFTAVYPAYTHWKSGARLGSPDAVHDLIARADICIIGGEDFPGLEWRHNAESLAAENSRLIVVDLGSLSAAPKMDLLVQARLGLVNEIFTDRPVYLAARTPSYGAALTAQLGLWAALYERESSGRGQIVSATLEQGAAMFWSQIWMEANRPSADFDKLPPKDVTHLIFRCADGGWIQFVLGVPGALKKTYDVLAIDIPVDPTDRGVPTLARGPASYFADRSVLEPAIAKRSRDELIAALRSAGVAVEAVLYPGEAWSDPQVQQGGLIRTLESGTRLAASPIFLRCAPAEQARTTTFSGLDGPPLSGIRVIDLGNFIAGPFASKLLADLGADVVKVEPPSGLANLTGLRNTWSCNRGKRSIILDMKSASGKDMIRRLCRSADVVHHNFRVGVAERLEVDPPSLRRLCPDIITLETSGYGLSGPKSREPAWDMVLQALCGLEMRAGGDGNPPLWYRSAIVDYATGALGAIAVVMALYHRRRHGVAVAADVSLLSSGLFLLSELVQSPNGRFQGAPLLNQSRTGFHPAEQLYRTRDGWIAIAARSERAAQQLAQVFQLSAAPRADWGAAESRSLSERIEVMTAAEVAQRLASSDVWCEFCVQNAWPALRDDPQARARSLVIEVPDATFGDITGSFGPPLTFSRSRLDGMQFGSAPPPGAHSKEILSELDRVIARV